MTKHLLIGNSGDVGVRHVELPCGAEGSETRIHRRACGGILGSQHCRQVELCGFGYVLLVRLSH